MAKRIIYQRVFPTLTYGVVHTMSLVPQIKDDLQSKGLCSNLVPSRENILTAWALNAFYGEPAGIGGAVFECRFGKLKYTASNGLLLKITFVTPLLKSLKPENYTFSIYFEEKHLDSNMLEAKLIEYGWEMVS